METYYIVFSSITHAMRLEKRTKQVGKRCTIVRTPSEFAIGGCGYSIRVDSEEYAYYIYHETINQNVKPLGLFCIKNNTEVSRLI